MEFKISRTSLGNDKKPCDDAYRKKIIRIDERGFKSFEEHDEKLPKDKKWLERGFNHKILPPNEKIGYEHIYREFDDEIWAIEIKTLEELLELKRKYGEIIVSTAFENPSINELEIYDDWRE